MANTRLSFRGFLEEQTRCSEETVVSLNGSPRHFHLLYNDGCSLFLLPSSSVDTYVGTGFVLPQSWPAVIAVATLSASCREKRVMERPSWQHPLYWPQWADIQPPHPDNPVCGSITVHAVFLGQHCVFRLHPPCHPLTLCLEDPERLMGEMGQFISLRALKLFQCVTGLGTGLLLSPFWWHLWVMDWKTGHGPAVGSGVWSRVRPWASMVKIPSFLFSWCTSRKHFLNPPFKIKKHGRGCLQRGQIEPSVRVEWKPRKQK